MLRPESWAVIATAAAGIALAVVAFIRTPPEQRLRVLRPDVEAQLKASPPEAQAVIIRADRQRALRRDVPILLLTLPVAALFLWIDATQGQACANLLGYNRMRIAIWLLLALPPLLVLAACFATAKQCLLVLRDGYWPPLDSPQYVDTLAVKGGAVRRRAILSLALLALVCATIGYGYVRFNSFPLTSKLLERVGAVEASCARASGT